MMPAWKLGTVQLLALGCVGIVMGMWLKRKFPLFDRLCIPTSIVGGMVFALLALAFHARQIKFEVDTTLRDVMMVAFMTTVGLNARWGLVRRGGTKVVLMLALASVGALLQNLLGIGLARVLRVNPLVGILSGSVALTGGPATAAAFGPTFEAMGVTGATELATASATFGIAISGLVGGYIGSRLIRRHQLRAEPAGVPAVSTASAETGHDAAALLPAVLLIGLAMGVGSLISAGMNRLHLLLPSYIGAMIAAAVIR